MKTALVALAKDEEKYIDEWIDYNVKLGFDDIFIFQNDWKYTGNKNYTNLRFMEINGQKIQNKCYNDFLVSKGKEYDFVTFLDIDEFLVIKNGKTLNEWLETLKDSDVIYINWRLFGDNGLSFTEDDFSVLKRFTKCDKNLYRLGKNFIHSNKVDVKFYNPHIVVNNTEQISLPTYSDSNGNIFKNRPWEEQNITEQCVEIFHFRNKTYQECYDRKFGKVEVFWGDGQWVDINRFDKEFENHNKNDIENTLARDFLYE